MDSTAASGELRRSHSTPTVSAPAIEPHAQAEDLPAPVTRAAVAQAAMAAPAALPGLLLGSKHSRKGEPRG